MPTDKRRPAPQIARHNEGPGYWKNETSGVLKPAVEAYLSRDELTPAEFAALRAYFRQWVAGFRDPAVVELGNRIDDLTSRQAIDAWIGDSIDLGIDPL